MLLEVAIGDAYGAGFEFGPDRLVELHNDGLKYHGHPNYKTMGRGRYTDDTQQTFVGAELIADGEELTSDRILQKMVEVFKRDERKGYSRRMYQFLYTSDSGPDLALKLDRKSEFSGSSMRVLPYGIFPDPVVVWAKARLQSQVTHNTPIGIQAAQAAALAMNYFLYRRGPKADVGKFVDQYVDPWEGKKYDDEWKGFVSGKGTECVMAAITAVRNSTSLHEVLVKAIGFTGDVDTVGAIAMGIAAHCDEITHNIPQDLVNGLENGKYGRDYLIALDQRLMDRMKLLREAADAQG